MFQALDQWRRSPENARGRRAGLATSVTSPLSHTRPRSSPARLPSPLSESLEQAKQSSSETKGKCSDRGKRAQNDPKCIEEMFRETKRT